MTLESDRLDRCSCGQVLAEGQLVCDDCVADDLADPRSNWFITWDEA